MDHEVRLRCRLPVRRPGSRGTGTSPAVEAGWQASAWNTSKPSSPSPAARRLADVLWALLPDGRVFTSTPRSRRRLDFVV
ncbi:hypothetical protein [Streptomyces sp. ME18-1-4]|uniref:hypothetical protein n=1 Tax=Streptomyces sp. ME18-1-4 TaxID=3028685 RepID=UPI0029A832FA|nr:hypothetical protein [Streptomyces sp. ME18-1-4]MDX3242197.1 hypothetical protein [Streptomyces sp. ME18-1-4]